MINDYWLAWRGKFKWILINEMVISSSCRGYIILGEKYIEWGGVKHHQVR